jgi:hypothetical protein
LICRFPGGSLPDGKILNPYENDCQQKICKKFAKNILTTVFDLVYKISKRREWPGGSNQRRVSPAKKGKKDEKSVWKVQK